MTKPKAIEALKRLRADVGVVRARPRFSKEFKKLQQDVGACLRNLFGDDSAQFKTLNGIHYSPSVTTNSTPESFYDERFLKGVDSVEAVIESAIQEIETYWPDTTTEQPAPVEVSTRVFVVHGHDELLKTEVARLLENLGLEPVILHEQANRGRTIIEKFEDHADVGFAVALLTPDDVGAVRPTGTSPPALMSRARQNVILELGYFAGRLGRERVAALHKGGVELPSDFNGVVYTPVDGGGAWKRDLANELKAAGYPIDFGRIK